MNALLEKNRGRECSVSTPRVRLGKSWQVHTENSILLKRGSYTKRSSRGLVTFRGEGVLVKETMLGGIAFTLGLEKSGKVNPIGTIGLWLYRLRQSDYRSTDWDNRATDFLRSVVRVGLARAHSTRVKSKTLHLQLNCISWNRSA